MAKLVNMFLQLVKFPSIIIIFCNNTLYTGIEHNSAEYLHLLIEAMQLSFADTWWYCADPNKVEVPVDGLLSKDYAATRRKLMSKDK